MPHPPPGDESFLFWPDDASIVDPWIVDGTRVHGARQISDTCLLALALKHGGRLVTLDSGIALSAARGATAIVAATSTAAGHEGPRSPAGQS